MPAQAGIHVPEPACVPAFAGMTARPSFVYAQRFPPFVEVLCSPLGAARPGADV